MKPKLLIGAALVAAIATAVTYWMNRAPYSGETQPIYFTVTKIEPVATATGEPIDLVAEYAFMASMFAQLGEVMEQSLAEGYLRVDPVNRSATLAALGTQTTASLPEGSTETEFDPGDTGAAPTYLSFGPSADTLFVRAVAQTGLGDDVSFRMTFERVTQPIDDRIARQTTLQKERTAEIAAWSAEMDAAQQDITKTPMFTGPTYRLPLPGDDVTMSVPLHAAYGEFGRYGRIEIIDIATGRILFKVRPQTLENMTNGMASDRNRFIAKPNADIRVLHDDEQTFLVARRNDTFYFAHQTTLDGYGIVVFGFFDTLDQVHEAWASALSISEAGLDPTNDHMAPEFDALGWFAKRDTELFAKTRFNGDLAEDIAERLTPALRPQGLMSRRAPFGGFLSLLTRNDANPDAPRTLAQAAYLCSLRRTSDESPASQHEAHIDGLVLGTPRNNALEPWGQYVQSGDFAAGNPFQFDPQKKMKRGPQVWGHQSATLALGVEEKLYLAYAARPIGPLQLICSTMSEHPVVARAGLDILGQIDLPDGSDLSAKAMRLFGRYAFASPVGDGLFEVKENTDGPYALIDADGRQLSDKPFIISWDYDDHRAFKTKDADGKNALWSYAGERLLDYEYDDFDDIENGIIKAFKDGEALYYSVVERRFVPEP